ncbi:MAG: hypothetical protein RBT34_08765 [Anaerolineaceae bacterium]|jgi:hypothetical protein|nr:hypothetical protein [Anaerolineaceae bacterium]
MIRISAAQYRDGIESRNRFMQMLHDALKTALGGVELWEVTSFSWQGYQIKKYSGLKDRQYYSEIYQREPNKLTFHEYYEMSEHPFEMQIDLLVQGFYYLPHDQQQQMLVDFIKIACAEAVKWNSSEKRREIVPEKFW